MAAERGAASKELKVPPTTHRELITAFNYLRND